MNDQQKADVVAGVSAAVAEYGETIKKMDFDAAGEFWADDPGFVIAGDGALVASYHQWMSQIKDMWDGTSEVNYVELFNPHVYVLSEDAAAYSTEYRWSITSHEGETTNARGSWTYVFKHLNGRWRVVHSAGAHLFD
jgi:ketosteroid isomerase-like protein